uniref:hypothetical protein n=1 Tax=Verrucomicrobium spinosum TaxID=2736 RepID=UPI000A5EC6CF
FFGAVLTSAPVLMLRFQAGPQAHPCAAETLAVLERLKAECNPRSVTNEYVFSTTAQPTELARGKILNELALLADEEPVLSAIRQRLDRRDTTEYAEMLQVLMLGLGDRGSLRPVGELMVLSEYPAVRICAARVLRRLHDVESGEFFIDALGDPRFVRNDACGIHPGKYYPVRTIAALALHEMNLYEPLNYNLD